MIKNEVQMIPADQLTVDPRVQRVPDPARIRKIAERWDDKMAGVLTVSHRTDVFNSALGQHSPDQFVVLDGQTRLEAFRQVCSTSPDASSPATCAPLLCQVYSGLTLQEEAAVFLEHNDRKAVHTRDRFRLANTAGEYWAIEISAIAAEFGWAAQGVDVDAGLRRFSAVSAAERVFCQNQGAALRRAFQTIANAWGDKPGVVCTETLYGLGVFFAKHPDLDSRQVHGLVTKLSKLGFSAYVGDVTADRRRQGISVPRAAYNYTVAIYNRGRSEGRRI